MRLSYAIKYVDDMSTAVAFFRDRLGLTLRFESPSWSEFETGETTLALHAASAEHPAGTVQVGFAVDDIDRFYVEKKASGIEFISEPVSVFGSPIAKFRDSEGAECSVSGRPQKRSA